MLFPCRDVMSIFLFFHFLNSVCAAIHVSGEDLDLKDGRREIVDESYYSDSPSDEVTFIKKSSSPSVKPAIAKTSSPSASPTSLPSKMKSSHPSYYPTSEPTITKSSVPSIAPSPECHDLASYRSPLNDFTCYDHRNTNCSNWKYLGLTDEDVLELYRSCPQTCSVECGYSLSPSSAPSRIGYPVNAVIDMYISSNSSSLSDDDTDAFEMITFVYLQSIADDFVEIVSVEVVSQTDYVTRERNLRRMEGDTINLEYLQLGVKVIGRRLFEDKKNAFKFGEYISKELESHEYVSLMNKTERFSDTVIKFEMEEALVVGNEIDQGALNDDIPRDSEKPNKDKRSSIIFVSITVLLSVFGVTGFLYRNDRLPFIRRHKRESSSRQYSSEPDEENGGGFDSNKVNGICISKVLSKTSSDDKPIDLSDALGNQDDRNHRHRPTHQESTRKNFVPPMIVFDNIDEHDDLKAIPEEPYLPASESRGFSSPSNLHVKRLEASSDLIAVLSAKKAANPIDAYKVLYPLQTQPKEICINCNETSPHTAISSRLSMGELGSLSTPCTIHADDRNEGKKEVIVPQTNTFTFNSDSLEQKDDFAVLFEKKMKRKEEKDKRTLKNLFKRSRKSNVSLDSMVDDCSHYISEGDVSVVSADLRERDRRDRIDREYQVDDFDQHSIDEERLEEHDSESNDQREKETVVFETMPWNDVENETGGKYSLHQRHTSTSSFSFNHPKNGTEHFQPRGQTYTLLAPSTGKLGITISSKDGLPPTVFEVKEYSPLLAQIHPGDRILAVDDVDTSKMNTIEVMDLLASKRSNIGDTSKMMKFVIQSTFKKDSSEPVFSFSQEEVAVKVESEVSIDAGEQIMDANYDLDDDDDSHSCHLIGIMNSEDWEESQNYQRTTSHFL